MSTVCYHRAANIACWAVALVLAAIPTTCQADENSRITLSGLLDFYYQQSFNHPPAGSTLSARAWDIEQNSFSLSLAEVNATLTPSHDHPVGFGASIVAGKTTDLVHATEPGGVNTYKNLLQVYGSVLIKGRHDVTLDIGKFQAWCCYDQVESTSSDNYSRSLLYTLGEPFYHMGLRASTMVTPKWMLDVYLVNGWNDVEDDNGGKSYGLMLMNMGSGPVNVMLNYIGGLEGSDSKNPSGTYGGIGFMMPGELNVQMVDFVGTWRPASMWKLVLNADYADASSRTTMGGHWSGQALILRRDMGRGWAVAVRGEHFEDTDGLRTGAAQNVNEVTGTLEYASGSHSLTRLEFRHDHAGTAMFATANGMSHGQDTLTLGQAVRF